MPFSLVLQKLLSFFCTRQIECESDTTLTVILTDNREWLNKY